MQTKCDIRKFPSTSNKKVQMHKYTIIPWIHRGNNLSESGQIFSGWHISNSFLNTIINTWCLRLHMWVGVFNIDLDYPHNILRKNWHISRMPNIQSAKSHIRTRVSVPKHQSRTGISSATFSLSGWFSLYWSYSVHRKKTKTTFEPVDHQHTNTHTHTNTPMRRW